MLQYLAHFSLPLGEFPLAFFKGQRDVLYFFNWNIVMFSARFTKTICKQSMHGGVHISFCYSSSTSLGPIQMFPKARTTSVASTEAPTAENQGVKTILNSEAGEMEFLGKLRTAQKCGWKWACLAVLFSPTPSHTFLPSNKLVMIIIISLYTTLLGVPPSRNLFG